MNNDLNHLYDSLTSISINDSFSNNSDLHSQNINSSDPDHFSHSGMLDFSLQYGAESLQFPGFETNSFDNHPQDYSLSDSTNLHHPQPNYHQNIGYEESSIYSDRSHESANLGQNEYHFPITEQLQVMNCHDNCPYTTISNSGSIYKHTSDSSSGDWVGKVDGRSVYNTSSHYLGYAGTDGKVYDNHDHCVGWVDGCHVYNKGGVEVYETTRGVVGAAAYLLCVYYGGVN